MEQVRWESKRPTKQEYLNIQFQEFYIDNSLATATGTIMTSFFVSFSINAVLNSIQWQAWIGFSSTSAPVPMHHVLFHCKTIWAELNYSDVIVKYKWLLWDTYYGGDTNKLWISIFWMIITTFYEEHINCKLACTLMFWWDNHCVTDVSTLYCHTILMLML